MDVRAPDLSVSTPNAVFNPKEGDLVAVLKCDTQVKRRVTFKWTRSGSSSLPNNSEVFP